MNAQMLRSLSRRYFLQDTGLGLGGIALESLLGAERPAQATEVGLGTHADKLKSHFEPKAKRVIFLFMAGGPSQLDLFDPKPALAKHEGEPAPDEVLKGADLPFIERDAALMASPFRFSRYGESGAELSELLPHLGEVADDVTFVRSMRTDAFNHAPAQIFLNTGHLQLGRPSMGAWVNYALGNEADDLPAFVVLSSTSGPSP